ncbi:hypothetical protein P280DRAFT_499892 [Massarina eburnea CBS 473.64]|uniref:Uncharacterized protein n=1 Tax=Massarina eburnea CBS 473.64 TaxID=1395130 RepID=A0A6A6RU93_9PLEO|nr:hypothetical protein P280DRAFT_499892 [Massarina eburnea CBS 473.64]
MAASSDLILPFDEFPEYLKANRYKVKYDSTSEPKFEHPWWDLPKCEIDRKLQEFTQRILDITGTSPEDDKELQHLKKTANSLSQVERSTAVKVALVGAQGAGKSLLTNAIFGCDGLSITGADGAACTSVIIRYANYPPGLDEMKKFFAQVRFLSPRIQETMINEFAKSYYRYNEDEDDSEDEENLRPASAAQEEIDRRAKDTAEDFFITFFGSRQNFLECWSPSAYKSGEFTSICQLKCEAALARYNDKMTSQGIPFSANDHKDLIVQIKPFLTKVKGEICLWPLVDQVTIRFKHPLLDQGVEVLDVPGWGDRNTMRARHAEEVKDTVDSELILADTIRIATDDTVINNAHAAMTLRGAEHVKIVATKIDSINANQLEQCNGNPYDQIKDLIRVADEQERISEEEDEILARVNVSKYKLYLNRLLEKQKIEDRKKEIDNQLAVKLQGRSSNGTPEVFHASAFYYMQLIKRDKIMFSEQPALKYLFSLPAEKNLKDYVFHINILIPSFIEKIARTTKDSDRDAGFRDLADEFDEYREDFMQNLLSQSKDAFDDISDKSTERLRTESKAYKCQVERIVKKQWFQMKGPTFKKLLNMKGVILKGVSKAQGLENGCNWNKQLSDVMASGFRRWYMKHFTSMKDMRPALSQALDQAHLNTIGKIESSSANLVVVEKAKKKWADFRPRMEAKLKVFMTKIDKLEKYFLCMATMEDGRENNLMSKVTDSIYDAVASASPATRTITTGKNKGKQVCVSARFPFQKEYMMKLVLNEENHLVDAVIKRFQGQFDRRMHSLLKEHFQDINDLMKNFSDWLREQSPIDYTIHPMGESIRESLEEQMDTFKSISEELKGLLPIKVKQEDETASTSFQSGDTCMECLRFSFA